MARAGRAWRGWFPLGGELTSGRPDQKEGLYFGEELPPDDPRVRAGRPLHGPNLFPAGVPDLGPAVLGWMSAMTALGHLLLRGIALGLGLEQDWFERDLTREPTVLFRIFHYPPTEDEGWGVGEHTDYGLLTILAQDDRGGLQVRGRDGWIDVPPAPGVLVCNIGDMLDRMTGGPLPLDAAPGPQRAPAATASPSRSSSTRAGTRRSGRCRSPTTPRRTTPAPAGTARASTSGTAPTATTSWARWARSSPTWPATSADQPAVPVPFERSRPRMLHSAVAGADSTVRVRARRG